MPLPLTVSCYSKIQIGFTFLVPAYLGSPGQRAVKWVRVCVCVFLFWFSLVHFLKLSVSHYSINARMHSAEFETPSTYRVRNQLQQQPFNGLFSRITWVSRYQKSKTNLDFTGARDSEWQWHQLGHMQVCTSLQTDNHASTPPLFFYRPDALPAAQPTASKHWRHYSTS